MKPSKLKKHNISTAEFWDKKKKKREILVALMLKYLTFNLKRKKNK
jgi:accessory gene regulator protein AgrB